MCDRAKTSNNKTGLRGILEAAEPCKLVSSDLLAVCSKTKEHKL